MTTVPEDVPVYTAMSPEGLDALDRAIIDHINSGYKLDLGLNQEDALRLVEALTFVSRYNGMDIAEWAQDFLSNLASSFGIEWV